MSYIGSMRNAINLVWASPSLKESFSHNRDKAKIHARREIQKREEKKNPPIIHQIFTKKEIDLNPCASNSTGFTSDANKDYKHKSTWSLIPRITQ